MRRRSHSQLLPNRDVAVGGAKFIFFFNCIPGSDLLACNPPPHTWVRIAKACWEHFYSCLFVFIRGFRFVKNAVSSPGEVISCAPAQPERPLNIRAPLGRS